MQKKTLFLIVMYLLFLDILPGITCAQPGFDKIYSFSPAPNLSVFSAIHSVYADSQSIFVVGETFQDSILGTGDLTFLGAFDYSGNLQWQKKLSFNPPFYQSTHPFLFHLLGKVSPDKYVVGAQGWDATVIPNKRIPRPFLYFFNDRGDSLGFSPIPYEQAENANFLYGLMVDKQKNIVVTGTYWSNVSYADTTAVWLAKLDSSGHFLWRKVILNQINNNYWAEAYKVVNSNDGLHYILGGRASHTDTLKNTWFAVWKTDTAGNVIWQKSIPKATSTTNFEALGDQFFDIIPAINGSGYYFLAVDLKPIQLPNEPESVTTVYYCGKLDEDGNVVWAKTYQRDDLHFEQVFGLTQKPNGDLLFIGNSVGYLTQEAISSGGPSLFCTDSLGNLKWLKVTKRYQCPYEVAHLTWSISMTPYGGIVRGGWIGQFDKQPGCYDTADNIAWLVLTDSLGRRSPDDTVTYPMIVEPVVYDSPAVIHLPDGALPQLKLYPNPTKDKVYVTLSGLKKQLPEISIRLYDYTGRLLQQKYMNTEKEVMDLSRYPSGIYFIRLRYGDKDIGGSKVIKR